MREQTQCHPAFRFQCGEWLRERSIGKIILRILRWRRWLLRRGLCLPLTSVKLPQFVAQGRSPMAFSARRGSRWKSRGTNGASRIPSRSVIHHPEEPPMLISHSSLLLFVAGAAVLLVIPGPAVTYVVSRSIGHGRAAGLVSVLGIVTGTLCHVVAAALGISALLASSAVAFQFVKYLGAAYLIYLGIKTLQHNDEQIAEADTGETKLLRLYGQGLLVNLLNPKTALFFLAFLPQFVDPGRGHVTLQILQLGILFALMGWCSDSVYAVVAGTVAERIRGSLRLRRAQRNAP